MILMLRSFFSLLYGMVEKPKATLSVCMAVLLTFTAGASIVLIIPLLSLLGINGSGTDNIFIDKIRHIFGLLHIPLNIYSILTCFISIIAFQSVLKYINTLVNSNITMRLTDRLRKRLYRSIIEADWIAIIKNKNSDLVGTLTREINQVGQGLNNLIQLSSTLIILSVHIIIAIAVSLKITVIIILSTLLLIFLQKSLFKKAFEAGSKTMENQKTLQSLVQESLQNLKLAKSQHVIPQQLTYMNHISENIYDNQRHFTLTKVRSDLTFDIGGAVIISLFIFIVTVVYPLSALNIVVLVLVFSRIVPNFRSIVQSFQQMINTLPMSYNLYKRLKFFDLYKEKDNPEIKPVVFEKQVEIRNAFFHYNPNKEILQNISLSIPAGKITAITGRSGIGKSTFADLLTGLLIPNKGEVLIDGMNLKDVGLSNWRAKIAYMPQESLLLHDSIRNNLLWSNPDTTETDMWNALKQANIADLISGYEHGLDTIVGERGTYFSGGERQRIALARALVRKPLLLILDEATSGLDEKNENEILDTIFNLEQKITIFMITHRRSTLEKADKVYLFEEGEVKQIK